MSEVKCTLIGGTNAGPATPMFRNLSIYNNVQKLL